MDDSYADVVPTAAPQPVDTTQGDNPYMAMAASMRANTTSAANQNLMAASQVNPDQYAQAKTIGDKMGLHPDTVLPQLGDLQKQQELRQRQQMVAGDTALSSFLSNEINAKLAQDDMPVLSRIAQIGNSARGGVEEAWLTAERANLYAAIRDGSATEEERARYSELKNKAGHRPSGIANTLANMAGGVVGALSEAYASPEAVAGAATGAAVGAAGLGAGALPGAGIGWQVGAVTHAARTGWNAGLEMADGILDSSGRELDDYAKYGMAAVNALVQGFMTKVGGGQAAKAAEEAIAQAVTRPTVAAALSGFGKNLVSGSLHSGAVGAGATAIQVAAEQAARGFSNLADGSQFATMLNDPNQVKAAVDQIVTEGIKWAAFGGALHSATGMVGLGRDFMAARKSEQMVGTINDLMDNAAASKLRERAPDAFKTFLQDQLGGSDLENLYVKPDAIMSLYQHFGLDPFALKEDPLFSFDKDMPAKLREAQETGTNVKISAADYANHIAGTDVDTMLRPDLKPMEDGYSARDLSEAHKAIADEWQARAQEIEKNLRDELAGETPRAAVYNEVLNRLRASGMTPTEAHHNALMHAAVYDTKAAKINQAGGETDAYTELHRSKWDVQRVLDQNGLRPLRAHDVNAVDALLNEMRSGSKPPSDREAFGPSLTEYLARHGGVQDESGELSNMGLDKWHLGKPGVPMLAKKGGRSLEDAAMWAADNGFLPDVKTKVDAGEPVDLRKELLDALDRDRHGTGVRSDMLANAEMEAGINTRAALQRALDDAGINLKHADWQDNQKVKDALALHERQAGAEREYGQASPTRLKLGIDKLVKAAESMSSWRDWYDRHQEVIRNLFGQDADIFQKILSATSQATGVKGNVTLALKAYTQLATGEPFTGFLPAVIKNLERVRDEQRLEGAKISQYGEANEGNGDAIAVDRHIARLMFGETSPSKAQIKKAQATIRAVADKLGWKAREVQAALWAYNQVREGLDPAKVQSYDTILIEKAAEIFRIRDELGRSDQSVHDGSYGEGGRASEGGAIVRGDQGRDGDPPASSAGADAGSGNGSGPSVVKTLLQTRQGSIDMYSHRGAPIQAVINLFAGRADKSTFMHESSHLWLEEMIRDAADVNMPDVFRHDLDAVMKWMGVERPEDIGTDQHEMFARALEKYLMEGKAPSVTLESTFQRFRSWLVNIYRRLGGGDASVGLDTAAGHGVRLDPEMRDVFDRMLATDDEIKLASERQGMNQLFKSAQEAGMNDKQFQDYVAGVQAAHDAAASAVERKAIADLMREKEQWWKDESEKVRADVEQEIDARPDIQAYQAIRKGEVPKFSADALTKMYGSKGILKELTGKYVREGGVHPDIVAEMFGFKSGEEMMGQVMNLIRQSKDVGRNIRDELVDRQTKATMIERHGDIMHDGTLEDAALDAVHNDKQGHVLAAELAALTAKARSITYQGQKWLVGQVRPWEVAKDRADAIVAAKKVRDVLSLTAYARAESKAAKEALQAAAKGDYQAAVVAKQQQMMAHAMWRAVKDAKDQVEKDQAMLSKFAAKQTIKGLAQEYLDQIHSMLERFDFKPASARMVEKRASLAEWITRQEDNGAEVMISDKLRNEAFRQHFSEMTVDDMRDLAEAVRNINHLGRLKEKIRLGNQERDFAEVRDSLVDGATGHPLKAQRPEMVRNSQEGLGGIKDRIAQKIRAINAPLMKIEQLCLQLDNDDSNGAWNSNIFRPMKDALAKRYEYENRIVEALREIKSKLPKDWGKDMGAHDFLPEQKTLLEPDSGLPARFRRKDLLAMMLNMGNDGNFDRLINGFGGAKNGWSRESVIAFVRHHATKEDWKFVQGIWDTFESFKDEIGAMQKRMSGVEPEWVKAVPFEMNTRGGQGETVSLRGGYFPVIYDLTRSNRAEELANKGAVQAMFGGNYARATTPKGHTKARAEGYSAPLDLNAMDMIGGRMAQHIHDLAFRETIADVGKLLLDPAVQKAVRDTLGHEYNKEFRKWLSDAASDRNIDPRTNTGVDRFLKQARINMTAVGIGWRFTTFLKHGTGALMNSIGELGPRWMAVGVKDVFGDPLKTLERIEEIRAKSSEMRYRKEQYDRDVMANLQDLTGYVGLTGSGVSNGIVKMRDWWNHAGHWLVSEGDWLSALPTWQGAYKKALHEGMNEADAIYAGDQAVRRAHGSQSLIDRAGIQRHSELMNALTMFYGFFNHIWNRQVGMVDKAKYGIEKARLGDWQGARADFATVAWRSMFYVLVPSIIEAAVIEGLPDEEEGESYLGWVSKAVAEELTAGVPVLRDVAKGAFHAFSGGHQGMSVSPLEGGAETLIRTAKDMSALFDDDKAMSEKALKNAITSAGIVSGFGTGAPAMYAQYIFDVLAGKEHPEDIKEFARHLLMGPSKH